MAYDRMKERSALLERLDRIDRLQSRRKANDVPVDQVATALHLAANLPASMFAVVHLKSGIKGIF